MKKTNKNIVEHGKIQIPKNNTNSPYIPQHTGVFVNHGEILKTLAIAIRDNLPTLLIGESGCLHPNTPIFDPITKTTKTVKERKQEQQDFHVYALNNQNNIIIAKAKTPKRYIKTKMYKLSNKTGQIIVTGKHRIWTGNTYKEISSFFSEGHTSAEILLPSISESSLSALLANVQNYSKTNEDSQSDCQPSHHSNGQPLPQVPNTDPENAPSQDDAHAHNHENHYKDDQHDATKHNQTYQSDAPHSKLDSSPQKEKQPSNQSYNLEGEDTSSQISQTPSSPDKSSASSIPEDVNQHNAESSHQTKQDEPNVNFSSHCYYTKWTVTLQQDEETYYDFHVPTYENYYACGLFHHNTGKTSAIRYLAHQTGNGLRRVNLNGGTTADELKGRNMFNDKGTYWIDGILTEAMRNGDWIVLDEINAALPEVLFVLQSVLDEDGYIVLEEKDDKEIVYKHPHFRLFATCNPPDYAGTKEMNKALLSRFAICINAEFPPTKTETQIIENQLGNAVATSNITSKLIELAQSTRKAKELGTADYAINTRDLLNTLRLIPFTNPVEALNLAFGNKLDPADCKALNSLARLSLPSPQKKNTGKKTKIKNPSELKIGSQYIFDKDTQNAYLGLTDDIHTFDKKIQETDLTEFLTEEIINNKENAIKGEEFIIEAVDYEAEDKFQTTEKEDSIKNASIINIITGPNKGKKAIILHHPEIENTVDIVNNLYEIN